MNNNSLAMIQKTKKLIPAMYMEGLAETAKVLSSMVVVFLLLAATGPFVYGLQAVEFWH